MQLSIVVPCYNEEKNIPLILEKFASVITRPDIEVILVDNGSTDNTARVLQPLVIKYPFLRIVRVPVNDGYGYGILTGLRAAKGEYMGWTHADLQTDPADVIKALNIIEEKGSPRNIYVKGLRKGRGLGDNIFTFGMSLFETMLLGVKLWDINAQPNIFHCSLLLSWEKPPHDFSLDLYALYKAQKTKMNVVRFPVVFPPRVHGHSHWNTGLFAKWKFIKRTLEFSVKLKTRLK